MAPLSPSGSEALLLASQILVYRGDFRGLRTYKCTTKFYNQIREFGYRGFYSLLQSVSAKKTNFSYSLHFEPNFGDSMVQ